MSTTRDESAQVNIEEFERMSTTSSTTPLDQNPDQPQGYREVLKSMLWSMFFTVMKFSAAVMAGMASLVILSRWIVHGLTLAKMSLTENLRDLYSLLDYLSPSSTPTEKEEKVSEIVRIFQQNFSGLIQRSIWQFLLTLTVWDWTIAVFGVIATIGGVYSLIAQFGISSKRAIQRLRGIRMESVREGSEFRIAPVPTFQVAVRIPGTFMDEHFGYGIRVNDYLVIPSHVIEQAGEFRKSVILVGPKHKVLAQLSSVQRSRGVDDLAYVYLDPRTWSLLGASKAKMAVKAKGCHATCTGKPGQSTGRVQKTSCQWKVSFAGSTLPGMSGAPYVDNGMIVGIHQGASGAFNIGVSSALVVAEMKMLCMKESPYSEDEEERPVMFRNDNDKIWKDIEALERLGKAYQGEWDADVDFDYNQRLDFGDESARPQSEKLTLNLPSGGIRLRQHAPGAQEVAYVPADCLDFIYQLREAQLEDRISILEQEIARLKTRPATASIPKQQFQCDKCETITRTPERLANHVKSAHELAKKTSAPVQAVVVESALPDDFKRTVKTGSFLGKRSSQPWSKQPSLPRNSNTSARNNQSPVLEASLSEMIASQKNTEALLRELLQAMAGPSSAMARN